MTLFEFISTYWPRLLSGTGITIVQFFLAAALGVVISLGAGLMKLAPNRILRGFAITYIEIFRGTSLVVQLYWIFFVLPLLGVTIDKFTAGYLAVV